MPPVPVVRLDEGQRTAPDTGAKVAQQPVVPKEISLKYLSKI